jgi:hypothetical protein
LKTLPVFVTVSLWTPARLTPARFFEQDGRHSNRPSSSPRLHESPQKYCGEKDCEAAFHFMSLAH